MSKESKMLRSIQRQVAEMRDGQTWSLSDPAFATFLGMGSAGLWGDSPNEFNAMSLSAWYRGASLVASTIAGLPLRTYEDLFDEDGDDDGLRQEVPSVLDNPAGPFAITRFSWTEMLVLHLINHGESFLQHIYNDAGDLVGLFPASPLAIESVQWAGAGRQFKVRMSTNEVKTFGTPDQGIENADGSPAVMTQILGLSSDGLRGMSPLSLFRRTLKTTEAGERGAERTFRNGAFISGLVTPKEDITEDEAKAIKAGLDAKAAGVDNAGALAVVNRALTFSPWAMTSADAQFLESRSFQISEIARIIGVPNHLLQHEEKTTSWGTGVAEMTLSFQKFTLRSHTDRIESALSGILPPNQFAEFDFKGLLQGTPADEVNLLVAQVNAGLMTKDEARAVLNLKPFTPEQLASLAPPPAPLAPPAPPVVDVEGVK